MKGRLCAVLNDASLVETPPKVTRVFNKDTLCEKNVPSNVWRVSLTMLKGASRNEALPRTTRISQDGGASAKTMPWCAEWRHHVPIRRLFLMCHAPKAAKDAFTSRRCLQRPGPSAQQDTMSPRKYASTLTYTDYGCRSRDPDPGIPGLYQSRIPGLGWPGSRNPEWQKNNKNCTAKCCYNSQEKCGFPYGD